MFLPLSVILFTGGRCTPLVQTPPRADTPLADIPRQTPSGRHIPLGRHLPGQTPPV